MVIDRFKLLHNAGTRIERFLDGDRSDGVFDHLHVIELMLHTAALSPNERIALRRLRLALGDLQGRARYWRDRLEALDTNEPLLHTRTRAEIDANL